MRNQVWSVSSLVRYLKNSLDNDIHIQSILLKGEISNFTHHRSGHLYFSLKDQGARMNCVMFSSYAKRMKIQPKEGMKVIVQAKVSLYEPQGNVQLYIQAMQSDGVGDLYLQLEALKQKLYKEGLFDESHKKELPLYPMNIGIISARTGAAIQDVLSIIARRWPLCEVKVYPSLVQGDSAASDMINKLLEADKNQHDVILLVRGGGSYEDLWCFNDEMLARTIYQMNTCIVSGVGHETDTTLVDYVSDKRAPTPSAAAELVTPDIEELKQDIYHLKSRMVSAIHKELLMHRQKVEYIKNKDVFHFSDALVRQYKYLIDKYNYVLENTYQYVNRQKEDIQRYEDALRQNMSLLLEQYKKEMKNNIILLDAYSPLKILERGYSIALKDGKAIRSREDVEIADTLTILLNDGKVDAKVIGKDTENGTKDI